MIDYMQALQDVLGVLEEMETLQSAKVVNLARRIRPGLTAEDIRNPHDFPELNDVDWHYADGHLSGIQAVRMAVRALHKQRAESLAHAQGGES